MTKRIKKFKKTKILDLNFLINNWKNISQKIENFPRYPLQPRLFNNISSYKAIPEIVESQKNFNKIKNNLQIENSTKNTENFETDLKTEDKNKNNKSEKRTKKENSVDKIKNEDKFGENEEYDYIKNLLKSDLKPNCKINCCCSKFKNDFCESVINESTWKSDCVDKKLKIECDDNCGCPKNCQNKSLQKLKENGTVSKIKTQIVWGIDVYTRKNIFYLLPDNLNIKEKN